MTELRVTRDGELLGTHRRRPRRTTMGGGPPLRWGPVPTVHDIDMSPDRGRTVDRRLVLALTVALDALGGLFATSTLR